MTRSAVRDTSRRPRLRGALVAATAGAALVSVLCAPTGAPDAARGGAAVTTSPATELTALTAAARRAAPSGKAMPRGNVTGWRQVFRDDFTGTRLKSPWTKYSGTPGGDPGGHWKPSHAVVSGGMLQLRTYKEGGRWVSAGVGSWHGLSMKYGRVDVRFRAKQAKGVSYALMLWPKNGGWPPEVDFAEDGGGTRHGTAATLHYGSANKQVQRSLRANFANWHTIGVRWSPGKVVYTLDGRAWATVKNKGVPTTKMVVAMQSQTWACHSPWNACPGKSTPARSSVDIDWVVAYQHT